MMRGCGYKYWCLVKEEMTKIKYSVFIQGNKMHLKKKET